MKNLKKKIIKEFRESESVKREYGENSDFIDVIAEGTTSYGIEQFISQTIDQVREETKQEIMGKIEKELRLWKKKFRGSETDFENYIIKVKEIIKGI